MPLRATHFVGSWITITVNPIVIATDDGMTPTAEFLARKYQEDEAETGVPIATIVEAYGSLEDRMRRALKFASFLAESEEQPFPTIDSEGDAVLAEWEVQRSSGRVHSENGGGARVS